MGEGLTDAEILAWMREHAAEHTIRTVVLTGELAEHWLRVHDGQDVAAARLLALADQVQAEVDAAQQAREQGEG
jgi:hypothetical protein